MKKLTLIFATMLIGLTSATAAEKIDFSAEMSEDLGITKRYRYTQPILFVERGVEFLVFPNGEFDFNTEIVDGPFNDDVYYRSNSRRTSINATFGAPGTRHRYSRNRGTLILHDRSGKVRRIGNVFLNYDRQDRIKRIGSVYLRYRHGVLKQVGGLTIQYNRFGDMIGTHGFVNRNNQGCGFCGTVGCTMDHFGDHGHQDNWNDGYDDDWFGDDDFYYYRQNGKKKKRKKFKNKKRKTYRIDD